MRSIEGKRGNPIPRPPFPAVKGLFDRPPILNNVETYANIPVILRNGPDWFASIGTQRSKGTKVFALGGKVNNVGWSRSRWEQPSARSYTESVAASRKAKRSRRSRRAVLRRLHSREHLDTPIEYETLTAIGSMMGSGGMIVMDEDNCMVDIAKFFLEFTVDESCGKCSVCRIGTRRMLEILERITNGEGVEQDLVALERVALALKDGSLCALGQTSPNPVLSTLRYFREEYESHVIDKKCKCAVCKGLLTYSIIPDLCRKCGLCAKKCPSDASAASWVRRCIPSTRTSASNAAHAWMLQIQCCRPLVMRRV